MSDGDEIIVVNYQESTCFIDASEERLLNIVNLF